MTFVSGRIEGSNTIIICGFNIYKCERHFGSKAVIIPLL